MIESTKLEVWFNRDLTSPDCGYEKIGTIAITMSVDIEELDLGPACHSLIRAAPYIMAAQAEDENMSRHSSMWLCKPGRVKPFTPSGDEPERA